MSSRHEKLMCDLKGKAKHSNVNFKALLKLINTNDHLNINKMTDSKVIKTIIKNIFSERKQMANNIEDKLSNLRWLNKQLVKFGEKPQPSCTKARNLLKKTVFINIFDLNAGKYENRTSKKLLIKDLRNHSHKRFPLHLAKKYKNLTSFLIKI